MNFVGRFQEGAELLGKFYEVLNKNGTAVIVVQEKHLLDTVVDATGKEWKFLDYLAAKNPLSVTLGRTENGQARIVLSKTPSSISLNLPVEFDPQDVKYLQMIENDKPVDGYIVPMIRYREQRRPSS